MLSCLNKIEVKKGDTFLINGGVPHAIGAGCFLLEVQEPTDYTIRTERTTVSGFKIADYMCHQGIGFDNMMDCFSYDGMDREEVISKYKLEPEEKGIESVLIDYKDTSCFALNKIEVTDRHVSEPEDVFYGLYVLEGEGEISFDENNEKIAVGDQFFVGAGAEFECLASKKLVLAKFYGPDTKGETMCQKLKQ